VFCVNGGVLPNTPTPGFTLTCVATSNYRTLTLLLGGVDYTFYIQAINQRGLEGPLSEAFEYRTISVVPKSIESLQVTPVPTPDQGSGYFVGLNWDIPLEAAITGGSALNGFVIRYAVLTQVRFGHDILLLSLVFCFPTTLFPHAAIPRCSRNDHFSSSAPCRAISCAFPLADFDSFSRSILCARSASSGVPTPPPRA
jgi:hypothetical protein